MTHRCNWPPASLWLRRRRPVDARRPSKARARPTRPPARPPEWRARETSFSSEIQNVDIFQVLFVRESLDSAKKTTSSEKHKRTSNPEPFVKLYLMQIYEKQMCNHNPIKKLRPLSVRGERTNWNVSIWVRLGFENDVMEPFLQGEIQYFDTIFSLASFFLLELMSYNILGRAW